LTVVYYFILLFEQEHLLASREVWSQ